MADTEPAAKKARTDPEEPGWPDHTLNINDALMKGSEGSLLSEVAAMPVHTLQGLTESADDVLEHLGVKTVADLGEYKFYVIAKALVVLATTEDAGKRAPMAKLNVDKAVNLEYETKSLKEIVDAPLSALQGLTPAAGALLGKLGVDTVGELGAWKYCEWASSIVALVPYEHELNAKERKAEALLKRIE